MSIDAVRLRRPVGKTSLASIALRAMATRDAQRCLASGSGRWEPIADWSGPPYTLRPNTYESRLSAYAPHLCDRGKTSSRPAVKWRWVPEGPGCSALRLPADTHVLTTAFCRRFAGSSILVVGESVQALVVATHRALDAAGLTRALCTCLPRCLCTLRSLPISVYSSGTGTSARKACARAHWEWRSLLAQPCARRRPRQR